jgi:hypothetical protein
VKILLDEILPPKLRHDLIGHDVNAVALQGWNGLTNGKLLREAAAAGFEVMLTRDRGIEFEQNLTNLPIAIVLLIPKTADLPSLRAMMPEVLEILRTIRPRSMVKLTE